MRSFSLYICTVFILFLAALLVGCGDDHKNTQGGFAVQSNTPVNGTTCVDPSSVVQITFNADADPQTVSTTNIQLTDPHNNVVAGVVTFNAAARMATLTPSSALESNTIYKLTVSGVKNMNGNGMSTAFTASFTTGPCAGGTAQYSVSLVDPTNEAQTHGMVSVDSKGVVTTQLVGAAESTTYTLQFCPTPGQDYTCFGRGDVTTDSQGAAKVDIAFPKSGSWAGDFQLMAGATEKFATDVSSAIQSPVYSAQLEPSSTTNGNGVFRSPGTQDPLTSGTLTLTGNTLQVTLNGASPNSAYGATECPLFSGSSCFALTDTTGTKTSFTTDSNGNGSFQFIQDGSAGDIFFVDAPSGRVGFVGGFSVP